MIKISNLDKIYYKGKPNEIHVINNTSLELPDTGLICFLGTSGSGKTTLLNTIGGLDKANKGALSYGDLHLDKYKMGKMDAYRSKNFGYVFQNYLLLDYLSVYDNLKLALELINITDPQEVKKRIEYCLKAVGLFKYRKKLAGQLSGGQMQRVSIARALVKQCKVIIADEPTGNLDSENTIEVMNILKKISQEALVLVVTHNREIAEFYSDRIIELKDGSIIHDGENISSGSLESQSDRKIHLLDMNNEEESSSRTKLHIYSDEGSDLHELTIVIKNNTIYVDSKSRIQLVQGSSVELVNDHYKKLEVHEVNNFSYDTSWYNNKESKNAFLDFFKELGKAFVYFYTDPKRKKLFNLIFTLIGIILAVLVLLQVNYTTIETENLCNETAAYHIAKSDYEDYGEALETKEKLISAMEKGYVTDMYMNESNFTLSIVYTSKRKEEMTVYGRGFDYTLVENEGLAYGRFPKTASEVVLGKDAADFFVKKMGKGTEYSNLIGLSDTGRKLTIVGISNAKTNSFYTMPQQYSGPKSWYTPYEETFGWQAFEDYTIEEGKDISKDTDLIASYSSDLEIGDVLNYETKEYTVVGKAALDYKVLTKDINLLGKTYTADEHTVIYKNKSIDPENKTFYTLDTFEYDLVTGALPTKNDETLASVFSGYKVGDTVNVSNFSGGSKKYKVTGTFMPKAKTCFFVAYSSLYDGDTREVFLMTRQACMIDMANYNYDLYGYSFRISDTDEALEFFNTNNLQVKNLYQYSYDRELESFQASKTVYPIIEAVLLGVILVYTYFSQRAKMISEIYDIGVLRSLGAKRSKLVGRNLRENFAKATLTTLLGYTVAVVIYTMIAKKINAIVGSAMLKMNVPYVLLGIIVLYASQLFIGALPLMTLLSKTPSEINSKYDI